MGFVWLISTWHPSLNNPWSVAFFLPSLLPLLFCTCTHVTRLAAATKTWSKIITPHLQLAAKVKLNGGSISGQLWVFGTVKFCDDSFGKLIEESPNSQLRVLCFTSMSGGFLVCSFFRPHHAKIDFFLCSISRGYVQYIFVCIYIYRYIMYIIHLWVLTLLNWNGHLFYLTDWSWNFSTKLGVNFLSTQSTLLNYSHCDVWVDWRRFNKILCSPIFYCWSFHVDYCTPGFVQNYPPFFATLRCITFFAEGYASGHSIVFRSSIVSIRSVSKYRILHQTPKHITAEESAKPWGTNKFLHGSSNQKTTNHQPPHDTTITHPFRRLDLMAKFTMQATTGCTNEGTKGQAHISWTYLSWLRTSFRWGFSGVW